MFLNQWEEFGDISNNLYLHKGFTKSNWHLLMKSWPFIFKDGLDNPINPSCISFHQEPSQYFGWILSPFPQVKLFDR